jgi:hypothetical protein
MTETDNAIIIRHWIIDILTAHIYHVSLAGRECAQGECHGIFIRGVGFIKLARIEPGGRAVLKLVRVTVAGSEEGRADVKDILMMFRCYMENVFIC